MKRKVNEIFYSLQGEGARAGQPSVFVRFSGCNLSCPFCDTLHEEGEWLDDDEILAAVERYPSRWVILTGGEPSLHIDAEFISMLKRAGKKTAIETNGTRPLPDSIDWVTLSPKDAFTEGGKVVIQHADEIKVVELGQELEPYFRLGCRSGETLMYLQPCFVEDAQERENNLRRTVGRVLADPRWRLSLQQHRLLDIR